MAASLLAMVARLSTDRPKYTDYASTHARALELADVARARLLDLADDDARAYAAFGAARKMPRESEEQQRARDDASRTAARLAAEVPLDVLRECARVAREVEAMAGRSNLNASSDLEVAARLAAAAGRGAAANVLVNLPMVEDDSYGGGLTAEVTELLEELERAAALVQETIGSGKLREPEPS
jgi:formiminotetrahydrofolate cyclodeaminase